MAVSTNEMTKAQWLVARQSGIGGSDAAAVVGLHPFKTALQVYHDKISTEPVEIPENDKMRWGKLLEQPIADHYAETTGRKVRRINRILRHPEHEWMIGNIDRQITNAEGETGLLEIKTAGGFYVRTWETEVPLYYYCQVQHYLAVTGYQWADIAILIDGHDFRAEFVKRDQEFIDNLIAQEEEFWINHVLPKVEPEAATLEDVQVKWPSHLDGKHVHATESVKGGLLNLLAIKQQMDSLKEKQDLAKLALQNYMGDAEALVDEDGYGLVTFKTQTSNRIDSKALKDDHPDLAEQYSKQTESRVFRPAWKKIETL